MAMLEGLFAGRDVFRQNVRYILALAVEQGSAEIILSDANFNDWPLGEMSVVTSLQAWSKRGRKLVLMAQTFTALQRNQARFVHWRQTWDHIVECRRCIPQRSTSQPSMVWTPTWVLHKFEGDVFQGYAGRERERRFQMRERLMECVETSTPGFPSTTLGL